MPTTKKHTAKTIYQSILHHARQARVAKRNGNTKLAAMHRAEAQAWNDRANRWSIDPMTGR